ncbi:30S ribosome-binding factor RbfA [Nocardioides sp. TRM66260-LWL]|uniref:30S ribosome-binding factor RbfA n=1 Tax=Nocardioides sp. TRM66260-LWL TaxID=2874478 RepID=UPI001CC33502|nr:30S ribosome-binding factor RbfA [Nocardioides sp. TRM66260-LWL]MBZ5734364.1 30S ribosome-binding factor RbfA [Nocardioides sp. TRM66260-LWL]
MANPRGRRIADRIQVIVAELLERRLKDPRLGFVTITDVRLTGDNQHASVYYTVLGGTTEQLGSAQALTSATGMIRSEVAKQLGMRTAPTITFVHDVLPAEAAALEEVLAKAKALDDELAARRGAAYAGEADPYRKPREDDDLEDEDEDDWSDGDDESDAADEVDDEAPRA